MIPSSSPSPLDRAAELWGIEPHYWDIFGRLHVTSDDTKRAILAGRGVGPDFERAIEERLRGERQRLVPPCLVLGAGPAELPINAPDGLLATIDLRPESGEPARFEAPVRGGRLRLPDLDLGYYDLTVSVPDRAPEAARLILTPDRAYLPEDLRCAGIAISLYGVRSARNWGCGDFRDLRSLIDWAVEETGAGFIALNPLHAIHNRRPYNTSPYLPLSVFYQNLLYLDVEAIEDF
ncbi:MAG: 4-alpha-glucanotransferase, partial [Candidatus Solibacter usitatus]|nr:4-alpha-glucanotransferase [Candidatus Solibacter usitatus]